MKHVEVPKTIKAWRVICAAQSEPDYSEGRQMLLYAGENPFRDEYMVLDGGHCSCYDWQDVDFDAVVYSKEELDKLSASKIGDGCYCESERTFWAMVRVALGLEAVVE